MPHMSASSANVFINRPSLRVNDRRHVSAPTLTEAAQLADDVGQADVGDTFQLAADVAGDGLATQVPRLDVPRHQRHGGVLAGRDSQP